MTRFRSALNKNKKEPESKYKPYEKEPRATPRWTQIVDMASKFIAACAVLAATFVANEYQSSMTTVNLLAKREEAESSLRAGMFRDLINPITASKQDKIPVDREQLMTELLALNFHEHFELKPLMLRVDERIDSDLEGDEEKISARKSLRSVARRVVQRQVALLTKEDSALEAGDRSCIYELELGGANSGYFQSVNHRCLQTVNRDFGELITLNSPNQVYKMSVSVAKPLEGCEKEWVKTNLNSSVKAKDKDWEDNWKGYCEKDCNNFCWQERSKEFEKEEFKVGITINHVCWNSVQELSPIEKTNANIEIDMVSALRNTNDPDFSDDEKYKTIISDASMFLWESIDNTFRPRDLRNHAIDRWKRIQVYQKKLADRDVDGYPLPDLKERKIMNPEKIQAPPEHIVCKASSDNEKYLNSNYSLKVESDFTLTPFDFPFTDNTLLADGTRFSMVLDKVNQEKQIARFKIIWFPKDYIAARERPVNFSEIRNKLGITFTN